MSSSNSPADPSQASTADHPHRPEVLFVCVHNAGRSQMAAAFLAQGCGDECPYFPGKQYLDWALADPAGQGVDAVRPIRDEIETRVLDLLSELGVSTPK